MCYGASSRNCRAAEVAPPSRRRTNGASPGPADGSDFPAASASAEELIAAIGLEPRHAHSGRPVLRVALGIRHEHADAPHPLALLRPRAEPRHRAAPRTSIAMKVNGATVGPHEIPEG